MRYINDSTLLTNVLGSFGRGDSLRDPLFQEKTDYFTCVCLQFFTHNHSARKFINKFECSFNRVVVSNTKNVDTRCCDTFSEFFGSGGRIP